MSDSKITMLGLYKWSASDNVDLFELMNLPDGIDKDTVVANIIQNSSEFEVMYPNPSYVHDSLLFWSKKWFWTFEKWIKAISIKYEPLYNYDRHEEWTDNNTHSDDDTLNSKRTGTADISGTSQGETVSHNEGTSNTFDELDSEVETKKSAFDSSTYSPYDDVVTDSTDKINVTTSDDGSITSSDSTTSRSNSSDDYDESRNNKGEFENVHKGYMYGNIGVTSSQDMLQQELDVAMFNLYDRITDIFIQEYCIPVYI